MDRTNPETHDVPALQELPMDGQKELGRVSMVDPQTWSWVFSAVAQVYGVLLGLFAIMITFGIGLFYRVVQKTSATETEKDLNEKAFKEFRRFSKIVFVPVGIFLVISILMLASGSSVNYSPYLFWGFGVLPLVIIVLALLYLLLRFIGAITGVKK